MGFCIDRYQYILIGVSIHINNTMIVEAGIDDTLLAQAGIENTLLDQAGIDRYHYWVEPVSIIQYGQYMDTTESNKVSIACLGQGQPTIPSESKAERRSCRRSSSIFEAPL